MTMRKKLVTALGVAGISLVLTASPSMAAELPVSNSQSFTTPGDRDDALEKFVINEFQWLKFGELETDLSKSAVTMSGEQSIWEAPKFYLKSAGNESKGKWSIDANSVAKFTPSMTCFGISLATFGTSIVSVPETSESESGGGSTQHSRFLPDSVLAVTQPSSCNIVQANKDSHDSALAKFVINHNLVLKGGELKTDLSESAVTMTGKQSVWEAPKFYLKSSQKSEAGVWTVENNVATYVPVEECFGSSKATFETSFVSVPEVSYGNEVNTSTQHSRFLPDVEVTVIEPASCSTPVAVAPVTPVVPVAPEKPMVSKPTLIAPPIFTVIKSATSKPIVETLEIKKAPKLIQPAKPESKSTETKRVATTETKNLERKVSRTSDSKAVESTKGVDAGEKATEAAKQAQVPSADAPSNAPTDAPVADQATEPITNGGAGIVGLLKAALPVIGMGFLAVLTSLNGGLFAAMRGLRSTK